MLSSFFLFLFYLLFFSFTTSLLCVSSSSSSFNNASLFHSCHDDERLALLTFKQSFTFIDPYFYSTRTWKKGSDCCEWEGIKCHPLTHHIILLQLSNNGINSTISSNSSLFNLHHLRTLDLSANYFYSTLSPRFGEFRFLKHLDLSFNYFDGRLPLEFVQLSHMRYFDLSFNFDLKMPNLNRIISNMSDLRVLNLTSVDLDSNFPTFIANLSSIEYIELSDCNLRGEFPTTILNLPNLKQLSIRYNNSITFNFPSLLNWTNSLESLDLSNNNISSVIPQSQQQLSKLVFLDLHNCSLHGSVPAWVWNVSEYINLSMNNFSGNISLYNILVNLPKLTNLVLSKSGLSVMIKEGPTNTTTMLASSLEYIDLKSTNIHGEYPKWFQGIGKDSLMFLDLSNNALTGGVESFSWSNLQYFDISYNMLQGRIPTLPPLLFLISFSNNKFIGQIDSLICNLTNLGFLDFSNNSLTGNFPHCLGNISYRLSVLNLASNSIQGTLPVEFSKCNSLKYLDLSSNSLQGLLPISLEHCTNLKVLNLAKNNFMGEFPNWLDTLPKLKVLDLSSNSFHAHIIDIKKKHTFPKLQIIDLSNNNFTGKIPTTYIKNFKDMMNSNIKFDTPQYMEQFSHNIYYYSIILTYKGVEMRYEKIITSLSNIDLSNNAFEGEIPECIGELVSIQGLNLSHNHLSGPIPPSIGKLFALESLDLSFNKLTGYIPQELVSLTSLAVFNVSQNQLKGQIPQGNNFNTFQTNSYEGNLGLCGQPLPECVRSNKSSIDHTTIHDDDDDESTLMEWKIVLMGFGSGLIVGLAWGYYMFTVGKPFWFIKLANKMEMVMLDFHDEHFGRRARKSKMTKN